MRLFRRSDLPGDLATLSLERGERLLAQATTPDGRHVVATDRALIVPAGGGEARRLPWHAITHAAWEQDAEVLIVDEAGSIEESALRHRIALTSPGFLPETVRERVMASIVVSQHIRLAGRGGVRIVARRMPGEAEPVWQLVFDDGLDAADPVVRLQAEQALTDLRRQTLG